MWCPGTWTAIHTKIALKITKVQILIVNARLHVDKLLVHTPHSIITTLCILYYNNIFWLSQGLYFPALRMGKGENKVTI